MGILQHETADRRRRGRKKVHHFAIAQQTVIEETVLPFWIPLHAQLRVLSEPLWNGWTTEAIVSGASVHVGLIRIANTRSEMCDRRGAPAIQDAHPDEVHHVRLGLAVERGGKRSYFVIDVVVAVGVLVNGQISVVQRLRPLLEWNRRIAGEEHQLSKACIEISFRRDERACPRIHHTDYVRWLAEIREGLVIAIDRRIEHLGAGCKAEQKEEGREDNAETFLHRSASAYCGEGEKSIKSSAYNRGTSKWLSRKLIFAAA